jgi:hypothetical protein
MRRHRIARTIHAMPIAQAQPYYRSPSRRLRDRVARMTATQDRRKRPRATTSAAR